MSWLATWVSRNPRFPKLSQGLNSTAEALNDPSKFQAVDFQLVLPGYFDAMHTPLIAGRTFTEADNAPDRNLVVVDEFLAAKAFPSGSAILGVSAVGVALGVVAALGLTRLMVTMLVGVKATDPVTFAVMALLFFIMAGVASWVPAQRASALDPTAALRGE